MSPPPSPAAPPDPDPEFERPTDVLAVILAAGLGTRMRSQLPKVLHGLCGRPMLAYVLDAAAAATTRRALVVSSPATDQVRTAFAEVADFAVQDVPRGTGDALRAALAVAPADAAELVVLSGDVPRIRPDWIPAIAAFRRECGAALALATMVLEDPGEYGRVITDPDGLLVERIVERKDATGEELDVDELNAGVYAFDADWVRRRIGDLTPSPATGELYLTQLVELARADGRGVVAWTGAWGEPERLLGINTRFELAEAEAALRAEINTRHLLAGVTMRDPGTAYVDVTVQLDPDVTLEPNVILRGSTRIGAGTVIGAGSELIDTVVGRDCLIWASVLESSVVEDQVQIGPFAHLRPGASIGSRSKLGNFAEVKNSRLDAGVQQHHFSYIGDAKVGERTNIGAGTVTANYDGHAKYRTVIGARAFVGSDTMLVAPVTLGEEARTGAGSVVTRDVPAGATVVGVPARQVRRHPRPEAPAAPGAPSSGSGEPPPGGQGGAV